MDNEAKVSIKFVNHVTGEKKLKQYEQTLRNIQVLTSSLSGKDVSTIKSTTNQVKEASKETKKISKQVNTAFNYAVIKRFGYALKGVVKELSRITEKSTAYLENINLYQVAFNGAYQEADKFINKVTEMYGLDESNLTNTVGIFRQLANAMNLSVETGTKLSTLLTQMSIDISSLYNIDIDKASSTLQSALAGQTKPIRGATGADITQTTLQTTLDTIGIQKYVGDLSYAEKRLLIIISLTDQLSEATNDFGRTINCGTILKEIVKNFVNLCKKGVNILKNIFANDENLCMTLQVR